MDHNRKLYILLMYFYLCKMGRKPTVSKIIDKNTIMSIVKPFNNGGGYIPVPKEFIGKKVKIKVL